MDNNKDEQLYSLTHSESDNCKAFSDRINVLIDECGGVKEFAQKCGSSESVTRKWREGISDPSRKRLLAIAQGCNVSLLWLASGEGPMREGQAHAAKEQQVVDFADDFALVDYLDVSAGAGAGKEVDSEKVNQRIAFSRAWLRNKGLVPGRLKAITAKGDSMHPTIPDGALILVDISPIDAHDLELDGIYVLRGHHGLVVKRLQSQVGGGIIVISDNPIYEHQIISPAQADTIKIAGRVVWIGHEV